MGFQDIVGHERIIEYMQRAIRMQKVSHAYLFVGEPDSGKKLLADAFAQALQCEEGKESPCGVCRSCKQAVSGNHPDIRYVTHEKAGIGVDDIRLQLNEDIGIKPYSGRKKIYIIDEAEKMTEQAQNALLKTMEEPPAYTVIMLLSSTREALLQTILSRAVILELRPVPKEQLQRYLMLKKGIPDYQAEMAAAFSGGNVGKAIRFAASDEFTEVKEETIHLLKYIDEMQPKEIYENVKFFASRKAGIESYLDLMELWYRDVLMYKATVNPDMLVYRNEISDISKQASRRTFENIENIVSAIAKTRERLKANVNFDISVELLLQAMHVQ